MTKCLSSPPENLDRYDVIAFDTETTGLNWPTDHCYSYALAFPDGAGAYVDIRHNEEDHEFWKQWLSVDCTARVICHNLSFDYRMAWNQGIILPLSNAYDTVVLANIVNEHETAYTIDYLANKYLGRAKIPIWELLAEKFGGRATRKVQMPRLKDLSPEEAAPYAMEDAHLALALYYHYMPMIEDQELGDILELERRATPEFIMAEMNGIRVNLDYAEEAADNITPIIEQCQAFLDFSVGEGFNPNSSPQVKKFFNPSQRGDGEWYVGDVRIGKTDKGQPSLGSEYLRALSENGSAVAQAILDIRSHIKTRDTFIRGHVLGHAVGGRVYPTINQVKTDLAAGTGTGRLSYTNPAMQQIPNRNKRVAGIVKPMFLPDEGHVWVDSDLHSFEVRVFAHLIGDQAILDEYNRNPMIDFHQFVADLTGLTRDATYAGQPNAKQLNLSMIFNQGRGATAEKMGMPWEWASFIDPKTNKRVAYKQAGVEAERVITNYHRRIPGVARLAERETMKALRRGYIVTDAGRHCRFPRGHKAYKASGIKIQATAADLNKENWIRASLVRQFGGRLILNTHDSYSFSMPEDRWREGFTVFKNSVEEPGRLRVPLILELTGVGENWWQAISGDKNAGHKSAEAAGENRLLA
jgi:DNA polymerase I-like protein with 3'-5' exonuclease and polymerase domains